MDELIDRAIYYAETIGFDEHCKRTYCASAKATLRALYKANVLTDYEIELAQNHMSFLPY